MSTLAPALPDTTTCGCLLPPDPHIKVFHTAVAEKLKVVSTVWTAIGTPHEACCTYVGTMVTDECSYCRRSHPVWTGHPYRRLWNTQGMTLAGLGEAHEWIVAQVRAGSLP